MRKLEIGLKLFQNLYRIRELYLGKLITPALGIFTFHFLQQSINSLIAGKLQIWVELFFSRPKF